jgi:Family of unknown function (DUF6788)
MGTRMKIKALIGEIVNLGAVLPGSVSKKHNVCGKKECRCKDPVNPRKHGPYNHLSYTIAGKSSSKFIKDEDLSAVLKMQASFKRLREICQELPLTYMKLLREGGVEAVTGVAEEIRIIFSALEGVSEKRHLHKIRELDKKVASWREKAKERTLELNKLFARVRQLEQSRDDWKMKAAVLDRSTTEKKTRS